MKKITAEHPEFNKLFKDIVIMLLKHDLEIDNEELFRESIESVEITNEGYLYIKFKKTNHD